MMRRNAEMLWMDVSIGAFKLRDQGLYSIWRTSLYSLLFFLSLPFCSDVATLCWQSLTVTFPLITTFHSPTLSMLSLMCCCCFLLSLSLIYYIYLVLPIFIYLFHFLLFLSAVICVAAAQGSWHKLYSSVQLQTLSLTLSPPRVCVRVTLIQQTSGKASMYVDVWGHIMILLGLFLLMGWSKPICHKTCWYTSKLIGNNVSLTSDRGRKKQDYNF